MFTRLLTVVIYGLRALTLLDWACCFKVGLCVLLLDFACLLITRRFGCCLVYCFSLLDLLFMGLV